MGKDCGSGSAVAGNVVRLGGNLLYKLGTHVFEGVHEFDLAGYSHTVLRDDGWSIVLIDDDVATTRAERHLDGVREGVDALLQLAARRLIKEQMLGGHVLASFPCAPLGDELAEDVLLVQDDVVDAIELDVSSSVLRIKDAIA